jgi:murein L,D-transpeptidase YcbB/YkuD
VGNGLQCERLVAETWDEVIKPNRPAILALKQESGFAAASVLLSISDVSATLWTGSAVCDASLTALASAWRGQALYLWRAPKGWIGPVGEGDSGSVVSEIVDAFAALDDLPAPPLDTYTPALAERVRQFQRLAGLEVDGVMDAATWQLLSDRLGRGFTLEKATRLALNKSGDAACR